MCRTPGNESVDDDIGGLFGPTRKRGGLWRNQLFGFRGRGARRSRCIGPRRVEDKFPSAAHWAGLTRAPRRCCCVVILPHPVARSDILSAIGRCSALALWEKERKRPPGFTMQSRTGSGRSTDLKSNVSHAINLAQRHADKNRHSRTPRPFAVELISSPHCHRARGHLGAIVSLQFGILQLWPDPVPLLSRAGTAHWLLSTAAGADCLWALLYIDRWLKAPSVWPPTYC